MKIGLVVNPFAGVGGPAGLKGSDGEAIRQLALAAGSYPVVEERVATMFSVLGELAAQASWLVADGRMGENCLQLAGLTPAQRVPVASPSHAEDTRAACQALAQQGVDLLLFAGGDGTARDVLDGLGQNYAGTAVLGIPGGVKMQSAVFATSPAAAGRLLRQWLESGPGQTADAEVMDLDEEALRGGVIEPRLYGYLRIPQNRHLTQGGKARHANGSAAQQHAIARGFIRQMDPAACYLIGPGSTTMQLKQALGIEGSLLGVDAVSGNGRLLLRDASRQALETLLQDSAAPLHIVLSPIGGQGYVLGRGNQQISPALLRRAGRQGLHVLASSSKLASLGAGALRVDSGDVALDKELAGYMAVTTGYQEKAMWPVVAG